MGTNTITLFFIGALTSLLPSVAVSYLAMKIIDGSWDVLWISLAAIYGFYFVMWVLREIVGQIFYILFTKRDSTDNVFKQLEMHKFPHPKKYFYMSALDYFSAVTDDASLDCGLRCKSILFASTMYNQKMAGEFFTYSRMNNAFMDAIKEYEVHLNTNP
ncbi:MAG: hypothetical protein H8D23_31695 [Candidatus Brocadiales bacterium]|nr:hypothetical protein [Candidatus Brocadiales bacterium]